MPTINPKHLPPDMKQVAERLRNSRTPEGFAEVYGAFLDGAHCDEQTAIDDWLAERDPTPLTVEVAKKLGVYVSSSKQPVFIHVGSFELKNESGTTWEIFDNSGTISTVGELRTLARLAGVELKKGGE